MKSLENLIVFLLLSFLLSLHFSLGVRLAFNYDMGIIGPYLISNAILFFAGWIKASLK